MKLNRLAIIVSNKKGDCYQVALNKGDKELIFGLLWQLSDGTIKVMKPKLDMELLDRKTT